MVQSGTGHALMIKLEVLWKKNNQNVTTNNQPVNRPTVQSALEFKKGVPILKIVMTMASNGHVLLMLIVMMLTVFLMVVIMMVVIMMVVMMM